MFMLVQLRMNMPGATLRSMSSRWGRSSGLNTGGTWVEQAERIWLTWDTQHCQLGSTSN